MKREIVTGSRAFFTGMHNFAPKDCDIILIVQPGETSGYQWMRQTSNGSTDVFEIVLRPKEELIAHALKKSVPMAIGRFLTPEFANLIGLSVSDLKVLRPMRERLDVKHEYVGLIYDAYIANGSFTLTGNQRSLCYESYMASRKKDGKS